jgi:hypothetical protein
MLKKFFAKVALMLAVSVTVLMLIVGITLAVDSVTVPAIPGFTLDLSGIFQSLAVIVAAFVTGLISKLLMKVTQKYGIQVSADNSAWIQSQAEHAVQYTAELAAKKLKIDKVPIPGPALLGTAVSLVVQNVPKLTREQAAVYVQAALARIPGLGATGDCSAVVGAQNPGNVP